MSAGARLRERLPVRPPPASHEDTRAVQLHVPWRGLVAVVVSLMAVMAAWTVTTNTYAVLWQQHLADRWTDTVARGDALVTPEAGQPVAQLSIPSLGISRIVLEGGDRATLRKAVGHEPGTALPGSIGNSVIRGHRLLWSAPFRGIGELNFGAPVYVQLADGSVATYLVAGIFHMDFGDPELTADTAGRPMLTLVTSDPPFRADSLLVIKAVMPPEEAP